jgi:hypothetical protein
LKPRDLIAAGDILLGANQHRPSQAALRRAVSTYYYAIFHFLARECADLLIGGESAHRSDQAWRQVYRSLEHGHAHTRCKDRAMTRLFPKEIEDFASAFVTMQDRRHDADYDPMARFSKSEVQDGRLLVEGAIGNFRTVAVQHRRAFCAYVLLRKRTA